MAETSLHELARYCDAHLAVAETADYPGALNGLQVENRGAVRHVAAAVDAGLVTIRKAIQAGADLLVVHHGLFWAPRHPWIGRHYEILRELVANDLAIYSAHLPLDRHWPLGNNAGLVKALGLEPVEPFFFEGDQAWGWKAETEVRRDWLAEQVARAVGTEPTVLPAGPEICRRIGVVTGGAGGQLTRVADEGVDTFITGEGPHWSFPLAEELRLNVIYGGHYATETFGVKALAAHLAEKYGITWKFVDHPSGL